MNIALISTKENEVIECNIKTLKMKQAVLLVSLQGFILQGITTINRKNLAGNILSFNNQKFD